MEKREKKGRKEGRKGEFAGCDDKFRNDNLKWREGEGRGRRGSEISVS